MIILGLILLLIGFDTGVAVLWMWTVGVVVLVIGLVLWVYGAAGHAVDGTFLIFTSIPTSREIRSRRVPTGSCFRRSPEVFRCRARDIRAVVLINGEDDFARVERISVHETDSRSLWHLANSYEMLEAWSLTFK